MLYKCIMGGRKAGVYLWNEDLTRMLAFVKYGDSVLVPQPNNTLTIPPGRIYLEALYNGTVGRIYEAALQPLDEPNPNNY